MWELTKSFHFEAAHTLTGTTLGPASEEIHGHSFRTEVAVRGVPDPETGMLIDLGLLEGKLAEMRRTLDHKFLNRIEGLEQPTLENITRFIFDRVKHIGPIARVTIYRDSCGETCTYYAPADHDHR
ncbi:MULTISPECIES: 6-pyruvoyl trahydropterin synthase family protein [Microvirga]|uniref:6-pyruvoyl trahydropterin synthase family protein n=1 Tax=Microvirga TaxID=186650 RepID=UPI001B367142|nr:MULTISPECIES: 6-carboxytetrahydropterin synthase [unclassified Microvirga]MBQ0819946.1 6-carboxytetrahydropterin synthase [Microvirga sp. HBU67558]